MKDLVEYLVKEIVSHPEAVSVEEGGSAGDVVYEVHVDPADVGKVIGRGGKVANALRTLVKAAASKDLGRAAVEIIAED